MTEKNENEKQTYPLEPDKLPNLAPLFLERQPFCPGNGAWVMPCPLTRCTLVVKLRELLELVSRQEPKAK